MPRQLRGGGSEIAKAVPCPLYVIEPRGAPVEATSPYRHRQARALELASYCVHARAGAGAQ